MKARCCNSICGQAISPVENGKPPVGAMRTLTENGPFGTKFGRGMLAREW